MRQILIIYCLLLFINLWGDMEEGGNNCGLI